MVIAWLFTLGFGELPLKETNLKFRNKILVTLGNTRFPWQLYHPSHQGIEVNSAGMQSLCKDVIKVAKDKINMGRRSALRILISYRLKNG